MKTEHRIKRKVHGIVRHVNNYQWALSSINTLQGKLLQTGSPIVCNEQKLQALCVVIADVWILLLLHSGLLQ